MTELERKALLTFHETLLYFGLKHITRPDFRTVLGHIRDRIKELENVELSKCATGRHTAECTCKPAELGEAWSTAKKKGIASRYRKAG